MIQLKQYITASKTSGIRKLITNDSKYKILLENTCTEVKHLVNRGETCTNKFWYDIFEAWQELSAHLKPNTVSDVLGINLWNNKNIKVNNTAVFYQRWYNKNVNYIQDLLNTDCNLLTCEEFQGKYNVHTNFLEFAGIRNPDENFLRRCQVNVNNEPIFNCHFPFKIKLIMKNAKGCKEIYKELVSKSIVSKSQMKWNALFENTQLKWSDIYNGPVKCCGNTKIHWFQYRIVHRIISTNDLLYKRPVSTQV